MKLYYKGGYFNIPQLSFKMAGTNKTTVPDDTAFKEIDINAVKIPVADTWAEWQTKKVTSNLIYSQETPPKSSGYYFYDKDLIYELYNGNILYIGSVSGDSIGMDIITFPKLTTTTPYGPQWVYPNITSFDWSVSPSIYYEYWGNYHHYFYMFLDVDGDLFMGYVGKGATTKVFRPGPISPDSPEWKMLFGDNTPPPPKFEDDANTNGGGEGEYKFPSEEVPVSPLPTKSAVDAGFVTLYNPSNDQLKNLAQYLWTSDFSTAINKMFSDPMDAILGLSFAPVKPDLAGVKDVSVGFIQTGVTMNIAASQYVQFDCGSVTVKEQWGNCLDYSPFTKVSIYLPYIGEKPLDIDEVMNNTIHLYYNIDLLSGACVAQLYFTNNTQPGRVLYSFAGVCTTSIPVNGRDFTQLLNAGLGLVTAGATAAITGGVGATAVASLLINSASNVTAAKPNIQKTSAIASASGLLDIQKPYLIFSYPKQSLPYNYKSYQGYPSNITSQLKNLSGFTMVEQIHVENIPATEAEKSQIESLLKGGVLI